MHHAWLCHCTPSNIVPGIAHDASHRKDFKNVTGKSSQARLKIPMINLFDSAKTHNINIQATVQRLLLF